MFRYGTTTRQRVATVLPRQRKSGCGQRCRDRAGGARLCTALVLGRFRGERRPRFREILDGTTRIGVASGIVSIWHSSPPEVAAFAQDAERAHPGRFLLGLGASHAVLLEGSGTAYRKPYSKMVDYLDGLDAAGLPPERRILAALGPRMLELSRDRSAGAHPYFVPAEHTAEARAALGPDRLLAPEVAVVLDADPTTARATARQYTSGYLALPNYTNNLRRFGWTDEDFMRRRQRPPRRHPDPLGHGRAGRGRAGKALSGWRGRGGGPGAQRR